MNGGILVALGGLAQGFGNQIEADQKRKDDLSDYKNRLQFATQMQEQLQQRKMELAQQFPTYTHFVTDPRDGGVKGFTPYGASAQLAAGDPELRDMFEASKQADIDKKKSQMGEDAAKLGLIGAQTAAAQASARLSGVKADAGGFATKKVATGKDYSPSEYKTARDMKAAEIDPGAFGRISPLDALKPGAAEAVAARRQAALSQASAMLEQQGIRMRNGGGGLLATPEATANPFADDSDTDEQDDSAY